MSGGKRARSSADRRRWREQPANERIAYANKLIILHPRFREAVDLLGRCHQGSQQAREPYCGAVLGASGAGKTSVVDHYLRQHPSQETDTRTRQPVLKVTLQPNASPKGIAADLLLALGEPKTSTSNLSNTKQKKTRSMSENTNETKTTTTPKRSPRAKGRGQPEAVAKDDLASLITDARAALREADGKLRALSAALKQHQEQFKLVRSTLSSLQQLQGIKAA